MEAETIIYYHPVKEQLPQRNAAKRHWWQEAVFKERVMPADDGQRPFALVDCPVPPFYYKKKIWPPEILSECMETVLHRAPGMADAFLHPDIMTLMSEKYRSRWETGGETIEQLLSVIFLQYASACLREQGSVTVLLGESWDSERQMAMTARLLTPWLPRINSLRFVYQEREGVDVWEEMAPHLEEYYYEYGLVPQLTPYLEEAGEYRCGSAACGGVILDYADQPGYPRISPRLQTVYVDAASCREKEQACAGKKGRHLYVSPLKYLDTMVKNSYDRLVHENCL